MAYDAVKEWLGTNDLGLDAWGRQKVVNDYSLFRGLFTYSVPNRIWEQYTIVSGVYTPLTQINTSVSSVNGALSVKSGTSAGSGNALFSKRHPRYQPNRGHLYSSATILPNATGDGRRRFGLLGRDNADGVYFELEGDATNWELYAVRKTNGVTALRQPLSALLPDDYDPNKGHVYDIQFQWRGVGNYKFFVDLQEIYLDSILGTLDDISLRIPALPVAFESETDTTTELEIMAGCVDVTSEGGQQEGREFVSVSTGDALINTTTGGTAALAIKVPRTINGAPNTRDIVASKISSWTRDEAAVQVYAARDIVATNLDALTWLPIFDDNIQYLVGGTGTALNTAFAADKANMALLLNEWEDLEKKNVITNPDQGAAPFIVTAGDILVINVVPLTNNTDNATTLYMSEEL